MPRSKVAPRSGSATASPVFEGAGGRLVERQLDEGRLSVDAADLVAVRIEREVEVDPNGYVVLVEELPSGQRLNALLFAVVFGLVALNGVSHAIGLRRRARAAS